MLLWIIINAATEMFPLRGYAVESVSRHFPVSFPPTFPVLCDITANKSGKRPKIK